jgi:hypothetical protein
LAINLGWNYGDKVWVTIPDYPDDYHPGQFGDNIAKTLANVERFIEIECVSWLPVIQARFQDIRSFEESCKQLREINDFKRVALGTVCKTRNVKFILDCCRLARRYFPDAWIHAFGPTLSVIGLMRHYVNSFDSSAWTFPRTPHRASCRSTQEREQYFMEYLSSLRKRLDLCQSTITDFTDGRFKPREP